MTNYMDFNAINPVDYIFRTEVETYVDEQIEIMEVVGQEYDREAMITEMEEWVKENVKYNADNIQTDIEAWDNNRKCYEAYVEDITVEDYLEGFEKGADLFKHVESFLIALYKFDIEYFEANEDTKTLMKQHYALDAKKEYEWLLEETKEKDLNENFSSHTTLHYSACFNHGSLKAAEAAIEETLDPDQQETAKVLLHSASYDVAKVFVTVGYAGNGDMERLAKMLIGKGVYVNLACIDHLCLLNPYAQKMWVYTQKQAQREQTE